MPTYFHTTFAGYVRNFLSNFKSVESFLRKILMFTFANMVYVHSRKLYKLLKFILIFGLVQNA